MTNDAIINGEVVRLTDEEVNVASAFHKMRLPFIWIDGLLLFNMNETDDRDHQHWVLEDFGITPEKWEKLPRGYILPGRIQFFEGSHFKPTDMASLAKDVPKVIDWYHKLHDEPYSMYNGVVVGKVGDVWPPMFSLDEEEFSNY